MLLNRLWLYSAHLCGWGELKRTLLINFPADIRLVERFKMSSLGLSLKYSISSSLNAFDTSDLKETQLAYVQLQMVCLNTKNLSKSSFTV